MVERDVLLAREKVSPIRVLAAARPAGGAGLHFAELDELLDLSAALDDLECLLAAHIARLDAGKVAAGAHALDKARALHALGKTADKINSRFVLVFTNLRLYAHVQRYYHRGQN